MPAQRLASVRIAARARVYASRLRHGALARAQTRVGSHAPAEGHSQGGRTIRACSNRALGVPRDAREARQRQEQHRRARAVAQRAHARELRA
jgi:hypothetical protein